MEEEEEREERERKGKGRGEHGQSEKSSNGARGSTRGLMDE